MNPFHFHPLSFLASRLIYKEGKEVKREHRPSVEELRGTSLESLGLTQQGIDEAFDRARDILEKADEEAIQHEGGQPPETGAEKRRRRVAERRERARERIKNNEGYFKRFENGQWVTSTAEDRLARAEKRWQNQDTFGEGWTMGPQARSHPQSPFGQDTPLVDHFEEELSRQNKQREKRQAYWNADPETRAQARKEHWEKWRGGKNEEGADPVSEEVYVALEPTDSPLPVPPEPQQDTIETNPPAASTETPPVHPSGVPVPKMGEAPKMAEFTEGQRRVLEAKNAWGNQLNGMSPEQLKLTIASLEKNIAAYQSTPNNPQIFSDLIQLNGFSSQEALAGLILFVQDFRESSPGKVADLLEALAQGKVELLSVANGLRNKMVERLNITNETVWTEKRAEAVEELEKNTKRWDEVKKQFLEALNDPKKISEALTSLFALIRENNPGDLIARRAKIAYLQFTETTSSIYAGREHDNSESLVHFLCGIVGLKVEDLPPDQIKNIAIGYQEHLNAEMNLNLDRDGLIGAKGSTAAHYHASSLLGPIPFGEEVKIIGHKDVVLKNNEEARIIHKNGKEYAKKGHLQAAERLNTRWMEAGGDENKRRIIREEMKAYGYLPSEDGTPKPDPDFAKRLTEAAEARKLMQREVTNETIQKVKDLNDLWLEARKNDDSVKMIGIERRMSQYGYRPGADGPEQKWKEKQI